MRIHNKTKAIISLFQARLFNKRIPLAVRWQLTNNCIWRCNYCNIWNTEKKELSLNEIIAILEQLAKLGTQTISFSGGEPMLRKDIAQILEQTKIRGISTEMNSTGAFIPQHIEKLKYLDFLKISLDGSEDVHDTARGKGSFRVAMEAAEAAKKSNLKFIFTTTLTKFNIDQVEFIISVATRYNTIVAFQPLKSLYRGVKNIDNLSPSSLQFKKAINKLIVLKKSGNNRLRNSLAGLHHILNWPVYEKLRCWAGNIFCIIDTDGTLLPCDRISYNSQLPNCLTISFEEALQMLPKVSCRGCGFCGVLELNLLMSLRLSITRSILRVVR